MSWLQKNCVVVPIDFSDAGFTALAPARAFVADITQLHVIYVLPPLHPADPAVMWNTVNNETRKQHVETVLQQKLDELGYSGAKIAAAIGDPSSEIVDYAKAEAADLIVMSSHGHTGLSRFMLGSVAERVVRLSHCPVLIIR